MRVFFIFLWWRDPDLNRGHIDFQSIALPTELSRRIWSARIIEKIEKMQIKKIKKSTIIHLSHIFHRFSV